MSDYDSSEHENPSDHDEDAGHEHSEHPHDDQGRITSPMQSFSAKQAGIGAVVLAVGLAVAFVLPYLLTV